MNTPFRSTIQTHIPWLAGVLEGDGCFGIKTQHNKQSVSYFPYISVQLTDQKLLEFIAQLLETNIYTYKHPTQKHWKTVYRTNLYNKEKLAWLLPQLMPFLSQRRQLKIQELMQILDPNFVFDPTESLFAGRKLPQPLEKDKYSNQVKIISETECQWLTGLVEAEGCLSFDRRPTIPCPGVEIQSTDQDVIAYTSLLLNKSYCTEKRLTSANNKVFTVTFQDFARLHYLFPKFQCYAQGAHLSNYLLESLEYLNQHKVWKALPAKTRPRLWPKKGPSKHKK